MSDALGAAALGIMQGLTEFLPVSSSGHLVILQQFVDVDGDDLLFDLALHVGTLVPAMGFYWRDIRKILTDPFVGDQPFMSRDGVRLALLVGLATVPTAVIGLLFEDLFEQVFHNPTAVGVAFLVTGGLLWSTRGLEDGTRTLANVPAWVALLIGLAQGLAITPGISRSGATIAAALLLGLERELAVKLSFLMSIPAIAGAVVLKLGDVQGAGTDPMQVGIGVFAAMVTGYGALLLLVRLVKIGRFASFAPYLFIAAMFAFAVGAGIVPTP